MASSGKIYTKVHMSIVTAELQAANIPYLHKKINYQDFLHIQIALRPN